MNDRTILSYAITFLGFVLSIFSMVFMLRGRPMAGDRGSQVIKYKGLELRTNALLMLLIVSVVVAVLPLGLNYYLSPSAEQMQKAAAAVPSSLFIVGRIDDQEGKPIEGARVTLLDIDGHELDHSNVGGDGSFAFERHLKGPGYRIKLRTEKDGYRPQNLILGVNDVNFPSVLIPASKRP